MNPEEFDIEMKKTMGLYPHIDLIVPAMLPYIRRLKPSPSILLVGDKLGEQIAALLEAFPVLQFYEAEYEKLPAYKKNVPVVDRIIVTAKKDVQYDVVLVDMRYSPVTMDLYNRVAPNGIFAGNTHGSDNTVILKEFRRENKITTPIQIANMNIWFWNKGR